jgi:hypothetical protein
MQTYRILVQANMSWSSFSPGTREPSNSLVVRKQLSRRDNSVKKKKKKLHGLNHWISISGEVKFFLCQYRRYALSIPTTPLNNQPKEVLGPIQSPGDKYLKCIFSYFLGTVSLCINSSLVCDTIHNRYHSFLCNLLEFQTDWIDLAQNQCRALVNTVMNLRVP